jgi:hydroxymethylbilane synthase
LHQLKKLDRKLIIGTRGSDLALWQANFVRDSLAAIHIDVDLKIIKTQGDKILHLSLDKLEGKGFFTKELEEELLAGTIDIAVHSHKDLPTENPPGLIIAAVSEREDPSELLLVLKDCVDAHQKLSVKYGGIVGTSSNRRKTQLLAYRPDLEIKDLRGNVPTRVNKLRDENYDAIMVARAGVSRLGLDLSDLHVEELNPVEFIPAPAQGVLAIQIREIDKELFDVLQALHHPDVAEQLAVERTVLNLFGGGCHLPLGCYCRYLLPKVMIAKRCPTGCFLRQQQPTAWRKRWFHFSMRIVNSLRKSLYRGNWRATAILERHWNNTGLK